MTYILVEGKTDQLIITHLLKEVLKKDPSTYKIEFSSGLHKIKDKKTRLQEFENKIIIVDADNGIIHNKTILKEQLGDDLLPDEHLFFLPNNQDKGNLETLLLQCIPENKRYILNCYDDMVNCITSKPIDCQLDHHIKATVYSSAHHKHSYTDYAIDDPALWDYNHLALKPLLNFLEKQIN